MIYFSGTDVFLSPNYYVQQLFGQNAGDSILKTSLNVEEGKKLTASTVRDTESGNLILKLVNGEDSAMKVDISLAGIPNVPIKTVRTVLTGPSGDAENEDGKEPVIQPKSETLTLETTFSFEAPANSLTVFRFEY
jgi:alpha-N-arabinofuranosidase